MLGSGGDRCQWPQALKDHEGDLISLEFVSSHLSSTLALSFQMWQLSDRRGSLASIWKAFHMLQVTFGGGLGQGLSWQCFQSELSLPSIGHRCSFMSE